MKRTQQTAQEAIANRIEQMRALKAELETYIAELEAANVKGETNWCHAGTAARTATTLREALGYED